MRRSMNNENNESDVATPPKIHQNESASGAPLDREQEHIHEWNPMEGMSKSLLSSNDSDGSTLQKLFAGLPDLNHEDVLCPFNDGKGRCYKSSCRYKHVPYSSKDLNELPKLHTAVSSKKVPVCIFSSLPAQILPATGCISKAIVTAVLDPENFYLIPEEGWKCMCSRHEKERKYDIQAVKDFTDHPISVNHYDVIGTNQASIHQHLQQQWNQRKSEFVAGELVAVKLKDDDGGKTWYRAKVLSDTIVYCVEEEDIFKQVDVPVHLLDFGGFYVKTSFDIISIPHNLSCIAPLAYKCRLNGISPIMGIWSNTAINQFKDLVNHQNIIAEVVRTPTMLSSEDDYCMVNLYIKSQDSTYIDAKQYLINAGLGIKWT